MRRRISIEMSAREWRLVSRALAGDTLDGRDYEALVCAHELIEAAVEAPPPRPRKRAEVKP